MIIFVCTACHSNNNYSQGRCFTQHLCIEFITTLERAYSLYVLYKVQALFTCLEIIVRLTEGQNFLITCRFVTTNFQSWISLIFRTKYITCCAEIILFFTRCSKQFIYQSLLQIIFIQITYRKRTIITMLYVS